MFCTQCGKALTQDAAFCGACGHRVNGSPAVEQPLPSKSLPKPRTRHPFLVATFIVGAIMLLGLFMNQGSAPPADEGPAQSPSAAILSAGNERGDRAQDNEQMRDEILGGNHADFPRFADYPVQGVYSGPTASLDLRDDEARMFKTRLHKALLHDPIDFAGEYVSAGWGCGTSCFYTTFLNKRTGMLIHSGLGGEEGPNIVNFRIDSRLVIAEGHDYDEDYNSRGYYAWFYELRDNRLVLVSKHPLVERQD